LISIRATVGHDQVTSQNRIWLDSAEVSVDAGRQAVSIRWSGVDLSHLDIVHNFAFPL
jgi:hypothetical protein